MKKKIFCILLFISVSTGFLKSQIPVEEISVSLEKLYKRLPSASEDSDRLRINDSIRLFIESYVASDRIFTHTFSNLKYLGQITSSDSVIKIITWNLLLNNEPGRYFCYFIRKSPEGRPNDVYYLTRLYDDKQF